MTIARFVSVSVGRRLISTVAVAVMGRGGAVGMATGTMAGSVSGRGRATGASCVSISLGAVVSTECFEITESFRDVVVAENTVDLTRLVKSSSPKALSVMIIMMVVVFVNSGVVVGTKRFLSMAAVSRGGMMAVRTVNVTVAVTDRVLQRAVSVTMSITDIVVVMMIGLSVAIGVRVVLSVPGVSNVVVVMIVVMIVMAIAGGVAFVSAVSLAMGVAVVLGNIRSVSLFLGLSMVMVVIAITIRSRSSVMVILMIIMMISSLVAICARLVLGIPGVNGFFLNIGRSGMSAVSLTMGVAIVLGDIGGVSLRLGSAISMGFSLLVAVLTIAVL